MLAVSQSMTSREISNLNIIFEEMDITNDGTIGFELMHVLRKHHEESNARAKEGEMRITENSMMPRRQCESYSILLTRRFWHDQV